ncbi:hypothetical protein ASG51_02770 [Methylobacterium sp. Leaf465]|uniref:hypothetical protein n=1 Tax=Methylobacterium sp. Leaf465 TaxID=1736385 RepID=UPI0006F38AB2|nr:hypothetical protein [Methylobacterium sp. Leaf465]KQT84998.1 hypothetical protein ASG51_02770 [Methylobacterium sp. Leaf465]
MAPREDTRPPISSCPIEAIAQAYLVTTAGNEGQALRIAITDALADLMEGDRRARAHSRLISRGYVRGGLDDAAKEA